MSWTLNIKNKEEFFVLFVWTDWGAHITVELCTNTTHIFLLAHWQTRKHKQVEVKVTK